MTPLTFTLITFAASVLAGGLGSLLGLGGGIIVVPVLTLLLHVNIRYAIGASIVSVIATSSGAAAAYVRERMSNLRVAMLLEIGTTTGALSGAFIAGRVDVRWLYLIFGAMLAYSAIMMFRHRHEGTGDRPVRDWQKPHVPNLTGTGLAYRPPGHTLQGGQRARSGGDYEPWQPT